MKTSEKLREARALIVDPARWRQGSGTPTASSLCADQACRWVTERCAYDPELEACERTYLEPSLVLARAVGGSDLYEVHGFNDSHTHAEVLAAFTRAIAIAEAEEQEQSYGDPLPDLEPAETDLATVRAAIAAHDAREAGNTRLLAAIREAEGARVDEDREKAA